MTEQPLWKPSPQRIENANLTRFTEYLQATHGKMPVDYESLRQWSIDEPAAFWRAIWRFHGVVGSPGDGPVYEHPGDITQVRWFPSAQLNFAENLLAKGGDSDTALIENREDGRRRTLTFAELREQSARLARTLREAGVGAGDRVAGFVPNGIEAVVGMLAATRLGAVWSSCSPDFGLQGVIDRFGQIEPKVLIAINGYQYSGKRIDTRERVADIVGKLPSLARWIAVDNRDDLPWSDFDERAIGWDQALKAEPWDHFERVPFNSPLYIMYSSGTTGVPKCIVHGVGGVLLQHLKELSLNTDIEPGDVSFYYTTCGWMMWNWMVSGLALGASLMLFDGSPFSPRPSILWELAAQEKIRIFGASAKYYAACEKAGLHPGRDYDLSRLDALLSTGSPLAHESFEYLYRDVKEDVCLSSISGGTDIVACFALGCPTLPVYRGELQCRALGMDVAFYDDDGNELPEGKGELVCRNAFPSIPLHFWNDPDGKKFRSAYFETFPGIWAHGDYGELKPHPATGDLPEQVGVIIHGRSDATLNPGGVRIGTAEIYRQVEKVEEVLEALAIGQDWKDDVRVVLFVRMREGVDLDDAMKDRIRKVIRANTTPRHVPARIIQVPDIPRTISGKIVELAVRNVVHGREVKNKDALANPEALQYFRDLEELKS